jgi:hypothetical protein
LQSASNLKREIFVKPDKMALNQYQLFHILKPFYRLSDAKDYWGQTLNEHHTQELKMEQTTGDFSLFYNRVLSGLRGFSDVVHSGSRAGLTGTNG